MGHLGGPDPEVLLMDEDVYPIPQDSTPEQLSVVSWSFSLMHRLMTEVKILDLKGSKLVKPPIFYDDVIKDDTVTVLVEECR